MTKKPQPNKKTPEKPKKAPQKFPTDTQETIQIKSPKTTNQIPPLLIC